MNGEFKDPTHNCWQCKHSWLGRCMNYVNYGLDISVKETICLEFTDGRHPSEVTFKTVGQLHNYLKAYFYKRDFVNEFTRRQLSNMLNILYKYHQQHIYFGMSMTKSRMVKHIEFYIKLHNLNCETK